MTHAVRQINRSNARGEPGALGVRLIEELVEETPKLMEGEPFENIIKHTQYFHFQCALLNSISY